MLDRYREPAPFEHGSEHACAGEILSVTLIRVVGEHRKCGQLADLDRAEVVFAPP